MAVIEQLQQEERFTDTEASLARYILANSDAVCRMGIQELADATFSSSAAVVRLCRKVGLKGFRELRVELAADLERHRTQLSTVDVNLPFAPGQQVGDVVSSIVSLTKETVDTCYSSVDKYDIERVARAIRAASHVYLFGYGDSEICCEMFANMILKLGIRSTVATHYRELSSAAYSARPGDVAIVVSYSGVILNELQPILDVLRARKCKAVLVSSIKAPMGFDLSIRYPQSEKSLGKIATFYSQECERFVLNCIYAEIFAFDYERSQRAKDSAEVLNGQNLRG